MEKLPPELLSKIMLHLPLVDRLSCSLTCRRFAEAMTTSQLFDDVWLDIAGHEMQRATSVLVNSRRQYTKLLLYKADLSKYDSEFWEKIGKNLRVLELNECTWSTPIFYAILQQCTKLESLKLVEDASHQISIDDLVLPQGACPEKLRDSLSHLLHLHLEIDITAETLGLLFGLMPNVTSVFLSPTSYVGLDFLERLPSILDKNRIIRTGADLCRTNFDEEEIIEFVEITSASLKELRVDNRYEQLTRRVLEILVSNSPDLEILKVHNYENLEDEDVVHLLELKKLRSLTLNGLYGTWPEITNECLCRLGEISTLVELDLEGVDVDSLVLQSLGCLTNLRSLTLSDCRDSECFEAICKNFERLTELDLGLVDDLTDADGMKLCRFKELQILKFYDGEEFTDLTFERGVGSSAMKSLTITGCPITDAGLASIASHHDRLEELSLHKCANITEAGIVALLKNEPRLKELEIKFCESVHYEWYTAFEKLCPRLRKSSFS